MQYEKNHPEERRLSRADSELLDRLLAGETPSELLDADEPERAARVSRLLSLLDQWEAHEAEPGLAQRTMAGVLTADPVSLSAEDGEALDACLSLRQQGLTNGPMPSGLRERVAKLQAVLSILDRVDDEPVPDGLGDRTMQAVEKDRQAQEDRSVLSSMAVSCDRQGSVGFRQIATTAALFVMALSILLPMLSKAQRDAEITQCSQNLAGLGGDLQGLAFDNKGETHRSAQPRAGVFDPLAKFARTNVDGSAVPANQASYFVLIDQTRVASKHLSCPSGRSDDPAMLYNGQNPAAGGPFRLFVQARPIFSDANPLYRVTPKGLVRNEDVPSMARSLNHGGAGQNVLISDGSVRWMIRPVVNRDANTSDNIWLYQPGKNRDSNAVQDQDIFLTP
ncbi:MAG: hypothetical protein AAGC44_11805 [Planctomycetota bacterium]